MGECNPVFAG